jgi:hypothetical protein
MNLPNNKITFLREVPSEIIVDKSSDWRVKYLELNPTEIFSFIRQIKDGKIYLLIPMFSTKSPSDVSVNLSEPFFVDNRSNASLIAKFILENWFSSGFEFKQDASITFSFKWKRVWFSK